MAIQDGWVLYAQLMPINDIKEHEFIGCWCIPKLNKDGLLVHNSADKREEFESVQ